MALPTDLTPEATQDREGFVHAYHVDAATGRAEIKLIVRDFEDDLLEQHVAVVRRAAEDVAAAGPRARRALAGGGRE